MQPDRRPHVQDSDTQGSAHVRLQLEDGCLHARAGGVIRRRCPHRHLALGHPCCARRAGWCGAGSQRPPPTPSPVGAPLDSAHGQLVALAGARGPGARVQP